MKVDAFKNGYSQRWDTGERGRDGGSQGMSGERAKSAKYAIYQAAGLSKWNSSTLRRSKKTKDKMCVQAIKLARMFPRP